MGAALLLFSALIPGPVTGIIALVLAIILFLGGVSSDAFSQSQIVALIALLLTIPFALFFSGVLLDKVAVEKSSAEMFQGIFSVFGLWLLLSSGFLFDYLELWSRYVESNGLSSLTSLLIQLGSATFFVASAIALSTIVLILIVELPFAWFSTASKIKGCRKTICSASIIYSVYYYSNCTINIKPDLYRVKRG